MPYSYGDPPRLTGRSSSTSGAPGSLAGRDLLTGCPHIAQVSDDARTRLRRALRLAPFLFRMFSLLMRLGGMGRRGLRYILGLGRGDSWTGIRY